jgi:natural product biosynthesis luciferase-like monooxygenase protein
MQFSLMFFASSGQCMPEETYQLVKRASQFADDHGFCAVWTPERHFHEFGGFFPNPAVLSSALAMITGRLQIRAGSLISPLHNTIRIAEDWALLDNLSGGRVGISFGSGWNVDDFVLFPDRYSDRRSIMYEQIDLIRKLWSGETITMTNGQGKLTTVSLSPKPVQASLPIWVTSSASAATFVGAGEIGANVLTHLIGQDIPTLASKIQVYRSARKSAGFPKSGTITLMLHTFLGSDIEVVRQKVAAPFRQYLRSAISLEKKSALGGGTISCGYKLPSTQPTDDGIDELLEIAFDRYFQEASLMGTLDTCADVVARLEEIGVNEIACLVDFGVDQESVLQSLVILDRLRKKFVTHDREVDSLVSAFTENLEN